MEGTDVASLSDDDAAMSVIDISSDDDVNPATWDSVAGAAAQARTCKVEDAMSIIDISDDEVTPRTTSKNQPRFSA